jgi:Permuted papain-like amidase enzyme, YaeF/YiiX, C92 family
MSNNAGVEPPKFPMRVSDFLARADLYLDRGDIILTRGNYLSSRAIRWIIGSFFSHAALVFLLPQPDNGFNNTFILESMPTGIGLAKLKSYIGGQNPSEDVAILRLKGKGIDEAYFKQVGALMLDYVKTSYDFGRAINLGLSLFFSLQRKFSRKGRAYSPLKHWVPSQFICSGFIQYGFVEALRRKGLDPVQVIFKKDLSENDRDGLLAISPEDIANSDKPDWLYAIRRGWVYEVQSFAEARKVILGDWKIGTQTK